MKISNTPPRSNNHNNYIAIAKAICIMAVVVWHSRPPQSLGIFTMFFAVPLFFFTSGYFYKPSKTIKELRTFYIKRIKGLYIPFVKWSLVFLVLHNVCFHLNLYNGQYGFRGATSELYTWTDFAKKAFNIIFRLTDNEQLLGAFWFIRALFIASLMVATIQFIFSKWKITNRYVMFLVLLIGSYVTVHFDINLPWIGSLGLILFSAMFYVFGFCYRKIENEKYYTKLSMFVTTFITFFGLTYFDKVTGVLGIMDKYVFPYTIVAISGVIMVLNLSKLIEKTKYIKNFFYYAGNNTMIILALHFTCLKIVSLLKIRVYGLPIERLAEFPVIEANNSWWWIAYTLVGVAVPLLCQIAYDNIKEKIVTSYYK